MLISLDQLIPLPTIYTYEIILNTKQKNKMLQMKMLTVAVFLLMKSENRMIGTRKVTSIKYLYPLQYYAALQ